MTKPKLYFIDVEKKTKLDVNSLKEILLTTEEIEKTKEYFLVARI